MKNIMIIIVMGLYAFTSRGMFLHEKSHCVKKTLHVKQKHFLQKVYQRRYKILKKIKNTLLITNHEWNILLKSLYTLYRCNEQVWLQKPVDMIVHDKNISSNTYIKINEVCNELGVNMNAIHFISLIDKQKNTTTTIATDTIIEKNCPILLSNRVQLNLNTLDLFKKYQDNGGEYYALSVAIASLISFNFGTKSIIGEKMKDRLSKDVYAMLSKELIEHLKYESQIIPFIISKKLLDISLDRPLNQVPLSFYSKEQLLDIKNNLYK